ncbi:YheT family hydrolase [Aestuariispira insulae]|uniref:Serine aminopeptidase S33 domain-containing protein n=1 Tax=Aestuariispira insulae TaxID=1461337 RepID=A0A3D9HGQ0_9PROT|nr:alpha/beta fold hydrolase [Aestuariispira insulae]RED48657.1 hypothetical protein DFP90_107162 [Aestuariispira insulae]
MELTFQDFRARGPWFGGDLQTLRNRMTRRLINPLRDRLTGQAEIVKLALPHSPGDHLRVAVNRPARDAQDRPLILLIHGLTGCEGSDNIVITARHFLAQGYPVARLNLRGAGPGASVAQSMYHAGLSADLSVVVRHFRNRPESRHGMVAMAVSLGGNMLLKYLGETGPESGLDAAVSVSAPISLKLAQRRIEKIRNFLYHKVLLHDMLMGLKPLPRMLEPVPGGDLGQIQRIYDFDNLVVAGYHGFRDADHYYQENSARGYLGSIQTPTLMIHAQDDPWIPFESYQALPYNPKITTLLPREGGHVGFHGQGSEQPWHDLQATRFFERFC